MRPCPFRIYPVLFRFAFASLLIIQVCLVPPTAVADEKTPAQKAYEAFPSILTKPMDITDNDTECTGVATVDLSKFVDAIPIFRDAWLTRDQSVDFYRQRARQLLALIVAKRLAGEMTNALYEGAHKPKIDCNFLIRVQYDDKFGHSQIINIVTWAFSQELNAKLDWDHMDERRFDTIASDYKVNFDIDDWDADEPPLTDDGRRHPLREMAEKPCDQFLFNANALFVRATTFCRKDYMDTQAGLIALQGSKVCAGKMDERTLENKLKSQLARLDGIVREKGRRAACALVEDVAQHVVNGER